MDEDMLCTDLWSHFFLTGPAPFLTLAAPQGDFLLILAAGVFRSLTGPSMTKLSSPDFQKDWMVKQWS